MNQQGQSEIADERESRPDWERFCKELLADRERMYLELETLRKERDLYRKALLATLPDTDVNFTKAEIFACLGKNTPLAELIANLGQAEKAHE